MHIFLSKHKCFVNVIHLLVSVRSLCYYIIMALFLVCNFVCHFNQNSRFLWPLRYTVCIPQWDAMCCCNKLQIIPFFHPISCLCHGSRCHIGNWYIAKLTETILVTLQFSQNQGLAASAWFLETDIANCIYIFLLEL